MLSLKLQNYKQLEALVFKLDFLNIPIVIHKKDLQIEYSESDSKIVNKLHSNLFKKKYKIHIDIRFQKRFKGSELIKKYKKRKKGLNYI